MLNFGFITDTHSNRYEAGNYVSSLKRISKTEMLDGVFHGGDILSTAINSVPLSMDEYLNAELTALNDYTAINNSELVDYPIRIRPVISLKKNITDIIEMVLMMHQGLNILYYSAIV